MRPPQSANASRLNLNSRKHRRISLNPLPGHLGILGTDLAQEKRPCSSSGLPGRRCLSRRRGQGRWPDYWALGRHIRRRDTIRLLADPITTVRFPF